MLFFVVNIIEDVKMFVKISINKIRLKLSKFEQKSPVILKAQTRQTTFWNYQD